MKIGITWHAMLRKYGFYWSGISTWKKTFTDSEQCSVDLTTLMEYFKAFYFFLMCSQQSEYEGILGHTTCK